MGVCHAEFADNNKSGTRELASRENVLYMYVCMHLNYKIGQVHEKWGLGQTEKMVLITVVHRGQVP